MNAPDVLSAAPPPVSEDEAARVAREFFGVVGRAENLASERDANFHIRTTEGPGFTLKFANPAEPHLNTNFQTEALLHLERADPTLPTPKVHQTLQGDLEIRLPLRDGRESLVRLVSWLDGVPVHGVSMTDELRRDIGRTLARLGRAFADFDHPASSLHLLWDIKNAAELLPLTDWIADNPMRETVRAELAHFESEVRPRLGTLRQRVVHNDLNHHNILVDPRQPERISGVLDFGDMVKTAIAIDVAVAASYLTPVNGPLAAISPMLASYHAVMPLEREEIELLRDLIVARLSTTITITEWRSRRNPDNAGYILRNNGPARRGMETFARLPRAEVTRALLNCCGMEVS
ncbi:phosphotransferase [Rubellimicrobium aerolatum]|uniref:Hydroxylysine kinase n=1 Tax=Rubellimicrobium aerolatum TaxID=490979 RepID=A0ABW0SGW7_9RHOB|nr:Ser/Thr protein kinase RdoA (MazF antagonist) [Rubellimicrobium aerolatum]